MGALTVGLAALALAAAGCDSGSGGASEGGGSEGGGTEDGAAAGNADAQADASSGGQGADGAGSDGAAGGDPDSAGGTGEPLVSQFGGPNGVVLRQILAGAALNRPMDLGFNPNRPEELWIANYGDESFTVVEYYGTPEKIVHRFVDRTLHFQQHVISLAFGDESTFGTCGDADNDYSGLDDPDYFMGPVLWESSIDIFYEHNETNSGGPHLDMLHNSPLCTGVAWESANRFYATNGLLGSVEWYDFREPHVHGGDDHSDGITHRLVTGVFTRVPGVPSHMELDRDSGWLFLADPGGGRVVRIDTTTGSIDGPLFPNLDAGAQAYTMQDVFWEPLPGIDALGLDTPAGLALHDGTLFVGDWGTGIIYALNAETGALLAEYDTERGAQAIAGIEIGPQDGLLYFIDAELGAILRVEPQPQ